jgi:hypothetical protein
MAGAASRQGAEFHGSAFAGKSVTAEKIMVVPAILTVLLAKAKAELRIRQGR